MHIDMGKRVDLAKEGQYQGTEHGEQQPTVIQGLNT